MSLSPGSQLGSHTIIRLLEAGAGGDLYHARDARLGREVVLKVLPPALAGDHLVRQRFEEQARLLAALSHAGIGAVFGFEVSGDRCWLVLERVEGETLAERLQRGPLTAEEALDTARQVSDALEAAHDRGVCHLDLRPACIQCCAGGRVKLMDFGLARPQVAAPLAPSHGSSTSHSATPSLTDLTLDGVACLSPEHLRGKQLDRRADSWSFGCILFHCLAGRPPFGGRTVPEIADVILQGEPAWAELPEVTPAQIRDLLERCLEKDRARRLRDLGDARVQIERVLRRREWTSSAEHRAAASRGSVRRAGWAVSGIMGALLCLGLWSPWRAPAAPTATPAAPLRVILTSAGGRHYSTGDVGLLSISPDGGTVLFTGHISTGNGGIFLRRLDQAEPQLLPIPGGWYASDPMLSPDQRWVGYLTLGAWTKYPLSGGPPVKLLSTPGLAKGATWGQEGLVVSVSPSAGLTWLPAGGGEPQTLTTPDTARGEVSHRWPDILPDGRHVLMTVKTAEILTFDDADIALLDLDSRAWNTIIQGGSYARYVPTGHIVYARDGALLAVPFSLRQRRVTGPAIKVLDGVITEPGSGAAQFALARQSGTLVYEPGGANPIRRQLSWMDRQGRVEDLPARQQYYSEVAVAPDGARVVLTVFGASDALFVYDLERETMTRATFEGNCDGAAWTPDGRILYSSDHQGTDEMYITDASGSGPVQALGLPALGALRECVRLEDGLGVVHVVGDDIWLARIGPVKENAPLIASRFRENFPRVSPDGRWLAYSSDESGQEEIYVRPFPHGPGKWQVSVGGGGAAMWSGRESELLYTGPERTIVAVRYSTAAGFLAGEPVEVCRYPADTSVLIMHPDGQKFLLIRSLPARYPARDVVAILNWFGELERLVPAPM